MAGESIGTLISAIGRIDHAIEFMARASFGIGQQNKKADIGEGLRDQLQSAVSSPAIIRALSDTLARGMGGGATSQIREASRQYESSIRAAAAEKKRETDATRRFSQAYAEAQRYAAIPGLPANVLQAIQGGTISPGVAHGVGGLGFQRIALRMQQARQQAGRASARRTGAQRAANLAASRGRQAAMGPGGIPGKQGGAQMLANVIAGQGLGGMGTLVGSMFGPQGAVLGFAFDTALKSVTSAFGLLDKAVTTSTHLIDQLSVWSFGGMKAAITLNVAEIQRQIYVSNELSQDMIRFSQIQKENIEAWREFDVWIGKINLSLASAWASFQTFVAKNVVNPLIDADKKEKESDDKWSKVTTAVTNTLLFMFNPIIGSMKSIADANKELAKDKPSRQDIGNRFTPWERDINAARLAMQGLVQGGNIGAPGRGAQRRLRRGARGAPVGGGGGIVPPGGPGGPGGARGIPPPPRGAIPPPLIVPPGGGPARPPGGGPAGPLVQPPPQPAPAPNVLDDIARMLREFLGRMPLPVPPNVVGLGGQP
jgi:hypothetical protein